MSPFLPDADKLHAVRAALPALDAGIYLNTGSCGPLPAETARAMAEVADYELRTGRAHVAYFEESLARMDEARAAVASVIGADPSCVALLHATTDAMNVATWFPDWRPGDRAVTSSVEHAGAYAPLLALAARGVEVTRVEVGTDADPDAVVAGFEAAIDRRTRLVSVAHVSWMTGAVLPVERIAAIAHEHGALVVVDGAQAVGAIPVEPAALGADAYAVPAQKWLLGPEGSGALWLTPRLAAEGRPAFAGWFSLERHEPVDEASWWPDARRFEFSNYHRPSLVGFARSIGWLAMFVGWEFVHRRGPALARATAQRLAAIPGVTVLTPPDGMATLVTFRIAGWRADPALEQLARRTFVVARTVPVLDAIRIQRRVLHERG